MGRINQIFFLLIVWLTLTSTAPFIFYTWPGHPYKLLTITLLLVMVAFLLKSKIRISIDQNIIAIIFVVIIYYLTVTMIYYNYSNFNLCIQFIALFIIILFINTFIGFEKFVKSYINIILIMAIGGVLAFFIHFFIGISPIFEVKYSATGISYFLGLTTSNDYYNLEGLRVMRYAGFFDEPGTFGLFSLFAIILNKIYFDNRKIEKWLIFLTLFTFSLAFIIIIFVYIFLVYFKISYIKYAILPVLLIVAFYFALANYKGNNQSIIIIKTMTLDRFKMDDKGTLSGNNRYAASLHDKNVFLENPFLGVQVDDMVRGNNQYSVFAKHGIFGSLFYYAFLNYFLILTMKLKKDKKIFFLKMFLVIILNFFHRPEFSAVLTLLIIYSMINYLNQNSKEAFNKQLKIC